MPGSFTRALLRGDCIIAFGKKTSLVCVVVIAVITAVALGLQFNSARESYNRFVDKALFENGVKINLIGTSKFSRDDSDKTIKFGINPSATSQSKDYVRDIYSFLGSIDGRSVSVTEQATDIFDGTRYVYIGTTADASAHKNGAEFVGILKKSSGKVFPNSRSEEFWSYLLTSLPAFNGTPLFFNSEFARIDFNSVIKNSAPHKLENTRIEKSVVFVNVPDSQNFSNYVALQEIFQEYNLASDINDPEFKLKSILYDHDDQLGSLTGTQRRDELQKNASMGLCPFDVMLTKQLRQSGGNNPRPAGSLEFAFLLFTAHYYHWKSQLNIFDDRCW